MPKVIRQPKDELFELAQKMYKNFHRRITPIYPWVLVRVLPKEQQLGSIWMPESQNKVIYEGIVLETWRSFWKDLYTHRTVISDGVFQKGAQCEENVQVRIESNLHPGDHVLFPHFEGMPVPYLNAEEKDAYRLVRETNSRDEKCEIYGKLEYQEPIEEQVANYLEERRIPNGSRLCASVLHHDVKEIVKGLLRDFYVVRKTAEPRTTSGYNGPR